MFQSNVHIFIVRNVQNAYLNRLVINDLSNFSLFKYTICLYFLNICVNQIDIHTDIQINRDKANHETFKFTKIRNKMEKTKEENMLQN